MTDGDFGQLSSELAVADWGDGLMKNRPFWQELRIGLWHNADPKFCEAKAPSQSKIVSAIGRNLVWQRREEFRNICAGLRRAG
jgi:hypothetical protein